MRRVYRSLSFILLPSVISVSAQAFGLRDVSDLLGVTSPPPSYSPLCDQYPVSSDKSAICRSYPKDKVIPVIKLPHANDLKQDTLYLVSDDNIEVDAPYKLKPSVGVLPDGISDLTLSPKGAGTDDDYGLCVMKFAEDTKVAGIKVDMVTSEWEGTPGTGKIRAIFCGSTSSSFFSESTIFGREDFTDLIHQYKTVNERTVQSYHRLNLYAEGSQNLIRVENADSSSAVRKPEGSGTARHVEIVDCTGTLSGNIPSSAKEQAGFVINNLVPALYSSSVFYEPLDASQTFLRAGLIATDTPAFYIFRSQHLRTQEGDTREQDAEEIFRNNLHPEMKIYSDENRYFALKDQQDHYRNELNDQSKLTYYLGRNEQYESTDVDYSADDIPKLSRNGGFFLGNAMQLKAICSINPGNYNETDPLPAINGVPITAVPTNATLVNFRDHCIANAENTACKLKDHLISGVIGVAIGIGVTALSFIPIIACICRSQKRSGYTSIQGQTTGKN